MTSGRPAWLRPRTAVATTAAVICVVRMPSLLVLLVLGAGVLMPLERLVPAHGRPRRRSAVAVDLLHVTLTVSISALILGAVLVGVASLPALTSVGARVSALPRPLAILIVVIIGEVGYYAMHRCAHEVPLLWRFHRIHHSSVEMTWLAAARAHPLDQVLLLVGAIVPLHVLGVGTISYGAYGAFVLVQNLAVHADIDVGIGPLRWVVATPAFHHWHHADEPAAINRNFAGQLPVLDRVFGTAHFPARRYPTRYGIVAPPPEDWVTHMASPLPAAVRPARDRMDSPRAPSGGLTVLHRRVTP